MAILRSAHRATIKIVLAVAFLAGCQAPAPSAPPDAPSVSPPEATGTPALPTASVDPEALIECRQVPEDLCISYGRGMMDGPQPEYAGVIERVIVTCQRLPPCAADRRDSGGHIMILYDNGWAWTQEWAVMSGV